MKPKQIAIVTNAAFFALALALPALADDKAKTVEAGKRGGRLLQTENPRPEFFVAKDHTVSVIFYDENGKAVAPSDQKVTIITTGKEKKKLELVKKDDALVSAEPLPEGDGYNLVVQVRANADARPANFRFQFLNHICGGPCGNPEYACTCDE